MTQIELAPIRALPSLERADPVLLHSASHSIGKCFKIARGFTEGYTLLDWPVESKTTALMSSTLSSPGRQADSGSPALEAVHEKGELVLLDGMWVRVFQVQIAGPETQLVLATGFDAATGAPISFQVWDSLHVFNM